MKNHVIPRKKKKKKSLAESVNTYLLIRNHIGISQCTKKQILSSNRELSTNANALPASSLEGVAAYKSKTFLAVNKDNSKTQ